HRVLKWGGFAVSFYGWNRIDLFADAWKAAGFRLVGHIVFRKSYSSSSRFLRYEHESAYLLAKGNVTPPAKPIPDVIDMPYSGNKLHPTQKLVAALLPLVEAFCPVGGLVLDPFAGSGSSLVAAQHLGRDWLGMELDADHAAIATRRLAWHAAKKVAA
ncbi:DNA methyltransferase, partial [Acetobacter indonesiensis]|uniref:DNA methyltransferase n=1 Tax=Acetobacter indonesiensis TaxID=104101 RepID=UPI0039EA1212